MPKRKLNRTFLEDALRLAKEQLPGWAYAVILREARARAGGKTAQANRRERLEVTEKAEPEIVPTTGPQNAPIAFVGASPARIEVARQSPLVGPHGQTFVQDYLSVLDLKRDDVVITNAVPLLLTAKQGGIRSPTDAEVDQWVEWLHKELDRVAPRFVIALGQSAKRALGDRADFVLPHPDRVRRGSAKGQLQRKLRQIKKALETPRWQADVKITKADEEKKIVYGVVLSAYGPDGASVDGHNDWIPPAEIEATAHDWFMSSRKIGISHPGHPDHTMIVDAEPVESSIETYLPGEYAKAMRQEPHRVTRREFGSDVVYSGDWILGTKLGDKSWADFKAGKWNAYSIEGFGRKNKSSSVIMPQVTFVDLKPSEV